MPAEAPSDDLPVEVVLRMLGEYSEKVATGLRRRSWISVLVSLSTWSVFAVGTYFLFRLGAIPLWTGVVSALLAGTVSAILMFVVIGNEPLQLAVWQLRTIYELASRIEDIRFSTLDLVHRLEFELRLSEAQFLLNRARRARISDAPTSREVGRAIRRQESSASLDVKIDAKALVDEARSSDAASGATEAV